MEKYFNPQEFMKKHKPLPRLYLVLDCETATLPFANEIAGRDEAKKKTIAIAKPIIYDIGWRIIDRYNNEYARHSFLVTETFFAPQIFNTAYYKDKRPIYLEYIKQGSIRVAAWQEITAILTQEMAYSDYTCAFNAMFDFKKAIPFTDLYIDCSYGNTYDKWLEEQKRFCIKMLDGTLSKRKEHVFDKDNFSFHGTTTKMIDIWGVACQVLINNQKYKIECIKKSMLSPSGLFFKTSAEATYRYLMSDYNFDEAHTAMDDATIESYILIKALKKTKIKEGIDYFPFRRLGQSVAFAEKYYNKIGYNGIMNIVKAIDNRIIEFEKGSKELSTFYVFLVKNKARLLELLIE